MREDQGKSQETQDTEIKELKNKVEAQDKEIEMLKRDLSDLRRVVDSMRPNGGRGGSFG